MDELQLNVNALIQQQRNSENILVSHCISIGDVVDAISKIKSNKRDGNYKIYSDHCKHGTHMLFVYLSLLFNGIVVHGYVPVDLLLSSVIPIPKDKKKSLNKSDNYRAIAMGSMLGKILDHVFLCKFHDNFSTSDLQFGFKCGHSTTSCSFVLQEVINHFTTNGSNVYNVLLDASKAFDRVNYIRLFNLLVQRKLNPLVIRFLLHSYTNQKACVEWGDQRSDYYSLSNGVKQGGVLSPILFSVYIDELLIRLKNANVGCFVGNTFMGALAYADDIALLAPSISALNIMLSICHSFSTEFDVKFNSSKSRLLVFGDNLFQGVTITFMNEQIPCSCIEKHLGNVIGRDATSKVFEKAIADIYCRTNSIISLFRMVSHDVFYKLFKTFCLHLYGCPLWNISNKLCNKVYICWRKCIRRIFKIPYNTHCNLLPIVCQDHNIEYQVHQRIFTFIKNCMKSDNVLINTCIRLALNGSRSVMSTNISFLSQMYNICRNDFSSSHISSAVHENDDTTIGTASMIRSLLFMRSNLRWGSEFFNHEEIDVLLLYLCTG